MNRPLLLASLALAAVLSACGKHESDATAAERIAQHLSVTQEVITNFQDVGPELREECKRAGGGGAICSSYRISLTNSGPDIDAGERDWTLYFHSIRRNFRLRNSDAFELEHIKGDLYRLVPTERFAGIPAGATLELEVLAENWMQFESDFMPRFFVVDAAGRARVIESTDSDSLEGLVEPINTNHPDNWKRTAVDAVVLASAASRYRAYSDAGSARDGAWRRRIIPKPLAVEAVEGEPAALGSGIAVDAGPLASESLRAFNRRLQQLKLAPSGPGAFPVTVAIDDSAFGGATSGAYRLWVEEKGARVLGYDQAGAFYGLQSLLALVDAKSRTLPLAKIEDAPRFQHRGLFLDVGRNFHSKVVVLKLLEQMAAYKLNRFHFHLSDDEGWRLEIPGLPELTDVGARRCFDLSENQCLLPQLGSGPNSDNNGSGFFSVDDYIEIVRFAAARHIEVIPEFDMPAHARAAVVAMEARYRKLVDESPEKAAEYRLIDPEDDTRYLSVQFYGDSYINPCIDSSYRFAGKLIREVQAMHRSAGQPLASWHFGGDEAVNILAGDAFESAPGDNPEKGDVPAEARGKPWSNSPQCRELIAAGEVKSLDELGEFYAKRVSKLVADAGIPTMAAWNDGVKRIADAGAELATESNFVNSWAPLFWGGGDESAHLARAGFDVVQSHSDFLYFDMPYEVDPKESGYYWASRNTDTRKVFSFTPLNTAQLAEISTDRDGKPWSATAPGVEFAERVRGIQGQLWSEVVRTDARVEYMIFPRLLALAERAWYRADWELPLIEGQQFSAETGTMDKAALNADWRKFAAALGNKELFKLDLAGIGYRVPVPGAVIEDGQLKTATPFPGLALEYFDGSDWRPLGDGTPAEAVRALRARSADGKRAGRAVELETRGKNTAQR
ncbi:family 20 glycosylhydrolase [Microbulbifer rhizosphaerae]|uniref:beta-N-acetylhexosaminidase n=1 Tax=Microbulbifer rhizosphaerae TaxID=1562603 RepID=A0A7W4ZAL5_9GAMM|nr:family 20 glycosylhydrolase [Microbulbifer rhizosphaerae]MBB3062983.1 hexosaminidase [Microbulbifer rhizosphaerae]